MWFLSISDSPSLAHRIKRGDTLLIPVLALNRLKSIWGDDASEFKYDSDRSVEYPN